MGQGPHFLKGQAGLVDVYESFFRCLLFHGFPDQSHKPGLFIVPDQNVRAGVFQDLLNTRLCGRRLHEAAGGTDDCLRIQPPGPPYHMPGLLVRDRRNSAGIDHINVSPFRKGNDLETCIHELPLHALRFVFIYLAAQIVQGRRLSLFHR